MKKLIVFFVLLFFGIPTMAETVSVEALENFSTENPPQLYKIKLLQDLAVDENTTFLAEDVLEGEIKDVKDPKRLKRDATFTFVPVSKISDGVVSDINGYFPAKYTTGLNKFQVAKSAALGVGSYFVKGLSLGYSAFEGAVKNEKDNRFKSCVNSVYENSPLSYVEKGEDIEILKGQFFLLNFDTKQKENQPNYDYEILDSDI